MTLWRKKPDPLPRPRYSASCVAGGCGHSWWASDATELRRKLENARWVATPYGWVCDRHVRSARALHHVATDARTVTREQLARIIADTLDGVISWDELTETDYRVADAILSRYEVRQHAHPTDVT